MLIGRTPDGRRFMTKYFAGYRMTIVEEDGGAWDIYKNGDPLDRGGLESPIAKGVETRRKALKFIKNWGR